MRSQVVTVALVLAAGAAAAQDIANQGPPPVLAVSREEIKPGKLGPHEKTVAIYTQVLAKATPEAYRVALTPMSGDDNVVLYLESFASFAGMEAAQKRDAVAVDSNPAWKTELDRLDAMGGDQHASQRRSLWRYRADLSYQPQSMKQVAQSRYMSMSMIRIKPGRVPDWIDYVKTSNAAREKAGLTDIHGVVYQAVSGAPAGTFLVIGVNRSLAEWDQDLAKAEERQKAVDTALGGEEVVKKRRMLISEIVIDNVPTLYAMSSSLSRPSPPFAAMDSAFWSPQPKAAATKMPAVKKQAPKQ